MLSLSLFIASTLLAQTNPPDCRGPARDFDARCGCVRDPNSKLCEMVKAGFYDSHRQTTMKPFKLDWGGSSALIGGSSRAPQPSNVQLRPQQVRPQQQARVVPLAHKDYLRFLHPNAHLAAGFSLEKVLSSAEVMRGLLAGGEDPTGSLGAFKEVDQFWMSFTAPNDIVLLMTGKFQNGEMAKLFYAQGVRPVFLGGAGAMMIGSEPSIQTALARLAKPATTGTGWVSQKARELSRTHDLWFVTERQHKAETDQVLGPVQKLAFGLGVKDGGTIDGEATADTESKADAILQWVERIKQKGNGSLDALKVDRAGATLHFAAKGNSFTTPEVNKVTMSSDFGAELYSLLMSGLPGMPPNAVSQEKMDAVRAGMKREDVLTLLGRPLAVSSIQGLETPRETWTYQVAFGKRFNIRLDNGSVAVAPTTTSR
jgi:hypothetical protein